MIINELANVVDAANVAAALTVKESAAPSPNVVLPLEVISTTVKVPVNVGDTIAEIETEEDSLLGSIFD